MMAVALPSGTTTKWVYNRAAAAAAAAEAAAAALQAHSPRSNRRGRGKGRRSVSSSGRGGGVAGGLAGGSSAGSSAGSGGVRVWFETPYASAWQYIRERYTGYAHFMGTSWAALWPVFLSAAVQQSMTLGTQVCAAAAAAAGH
jgi:hypothetical protein